MLYLKLQRAVDLLREAVNVEMEAIERERKEMVEAYRNKKETERKNG